MIHAPIIIQAKFVFETYRPRKVLFSAALSLICAVFSSMPAVAGGGLVLEGDVCIIRIDFYSAHVTAYQPDSSGNTQFCQDLPGTGETIIVLDYLHQSLKDVPVDFRVIRNVTGQGNFVKLKHVQEIQDLETHTIFYQPATIQADASLKIEFDLKEKGSYIGIVSAGHPTNDNIYTAVFPFEVGRTRFGYLPVMILLVLGCGYFFRRRHVHSRQTEALQEKKL